MKEMKQPLKSDEKNIYDAFSKIEVDTDKLKRSVLMNKNKKVKTRGKLRLVMVATFIFVALSTTIYAATGGLEEFLSRFKPNFGEYAIPPIEPTFAEDNGIRIEVVGAQEIDNVVLLYVSMQDTTGENRLTKMSHPDIEILLDGEVMNGGLSSQRLKFDDETNTLYFEMRIVGNSSVKEVSNDGLVDLTCSAIYDNQKSGKAQKLTEGFWEMQVNTSDLGIEPIVWENVPVGDIHINSMSVSPFGVRLTGSHQWDMTKPNDLKITIEFENSKDVKISGMSGGISDNEFELFSYTDAPINIDDITAVVIDGVRIPVE